MTTKDRTWEELPFGVWAEKGNRQRNERSSQKGRRKTRRERCLPFPKGKKTEPAEAKKEGEECRNPLNLAIALPDRKTMRYNVFCNSFWQVFKRLIIPSADDNLVKRALLESIGGSVIWYSPCIKFFYSSIVDLQCCVSFRCRAK